MGKITFECETVTPLFMYGADGKTPELRPASIKGLMRFWWRAVNGDSDIEKLKKAEGEIFGSTEKKSKVNIRLKYIPHKENILKIEKVEKMDYLWYPFYLDNADKEKGCFVNLKFTVTLSSYNEEALREACSSFILLSLFGGLGSRSRRGGGSFRIKSVSDKSYEKFIYINPRNIQKSLEEKYSNLSTLNLKVSNGKNRWDLALKDINNEYKKFRKKEKILNNASFGLPIIFEDKKNPKNNVEVLTEPEFERRASPLIIKVLKVEEKFYWLVLKLDGEFLPQGTKLIKIKNGKEETRGDIDEDIVDRFIRELKI